MLKEISCNYFLENPIKFSKGLNVILGDDLSTNSIGKSTLLMIIDFIFGGTTFVTKDSGSQRELGHQNYSFVFEFNSISYYYERNTENSDIVIVCDKDFNKISEMSIDAYTNQLKDLYNLKNEYLSFRSIVSLYSRIWGKDNYNVDKPLQAFLKEKESTSITNLIKLFNLYNSISETEKNIKEQDESKKILEGLHKKNYVQKLTKTEFKKNLLEIEEKQNTINKIKDNLLQYTLNIEELTSKEMISLKTEKSKLLEVQSGIQNKIKRLELNLEQKGAKSKYFNKLSNFFENANESKISEIEDFHNKIGAILNKELSSAKKILEDENISFHKQIQQIDLKISSLLDNVNSPKFIVDKLYDLTIESNKLETVNKFYEEKVNVLREIKKLNTDLDSTITEILNVIQEKINSELVKVNSEIHEKNKKTPNIKLNRKSYLFDHSGDTGTGKSFSDLIEFDFVILKLTTLPILMHDSPLFKNIGDLIFDKIVQHYSKIDNQIFISIDGINRFKKETIDILTRKKVIQLSDNKQLFNKDWRIKPNR